MIRIINPASELYVDGIFFLEQAKKETNQFLKWRYMRASLLVSYYPLEAAINVKLNIEKEDNRGLDKKWKDQFDCTKRIENENWNIFKDLKEVRELLLIID